MGLRIPQQKNSWVGMGPQPVPTQEMINEEALRAQEAEGIPASQIQQLTQQLNAKGLDSIRGQGEGIDKMRQQLAAYAEMPSQLDLSPLLALVDHEAGSKLAQSYKRPAGAEDKIAQINALQGGIQRAQQGLSDSEIELLKNQLQNMYKTKELEVSSADKKLKVEQANLAKEQAQDLKNEKMNAESREKYNKQFGEKIAGLGELSQGLSRVKGIIDRTGDVPLPGSPEKLEYDAGMSQMLVAYNRYKAELGALAGQDVKLLSAAIAGGPDALSNYLKTQVSGGGAKASAVLEKLQKSIDKNVDDIGAYQKKTWSGRTDDLHNEYTQKYQQSRDMFKEPAAGAPRPGDVVDGYTFKGGDPGVAGNWEAPK